MIMHFEKVTQLEGFFQSANCFLKWVVTSHNTVVEWLNVSNYMYIAFYTTDCVYLFTSILPMVAQLREGETDT